jgi:hypothetical protein
MTPTTKVPIVAGHLRGSAFWDPRLHTFAVTLDVFESDEATPPCPPPECPPTRCYPPSSIRHGTRFAEFITSDALLNHLTGMGLSPDEQSLAAVDRYGRVIADALGETEFVGLTTSAGTATEPPVRRLFLRTPVGKLLPLNPRITHIDHRFDWGNVGPSTVDTARLIGEISFIRRPGSDLDAFALALTYEFLGDAADDFSVSASAVCDWYLTDSEPWTTIETSALPAIRASLGLRSSAAGAGLSWRG